MTGLSRRRSRDSESDQEPEHQAYTLGGRPPQMPQFPGGASGPSFPVSPGSSGFVMPEPSHAPQFSSEPNAQNPFGAPREKDSPMYEQGPSASSGGEKDRGLNFHLPGHGHQNQPGSPPAYTPPAAPPPSGYRLALSFSTPFPSNEQVGQAPCADVNGAPVYLGSAIFEKSVHPCKVAPHLRPACRVAYGGSEKEHFGRYDLLPFLPQQMEFVRASGGRIPAGRRPVEGGYEENGAQLYHGIGSIHGARVPGKVGTHLGGLNVAFGGGEHVLLEYDLLCWR